jgi:hypothetical protein
MLGSVAQWCSDRALPGFTLQFPAGAYYVQSPSEDPQGPGVPETAGSEFDRRMLRGGFCARPLTAEIASSSLAPPTGKALREKELRKASRLDSSRRAGFWTDLKVDSEAGSGASSVRFPNCAFRHALRTCLSRRSSLLYPCLTVVSLSLVG